MAHPVTPDGVFHCAHLGKGKPTGTSKLTVGGEKPVLPFAAAAQVTTYSGCGNANAGGPCAATAPLPPTGNPGAATHLTVGGVPVLLDALTAQTSPPVGTLQSVDAGQTTLTAT